MGNPPGGSIGPGTRLKERYRLERLLGRGGMASVWLATDETLERPVAIKLLADTIASDPEFLARFRREAKVAASLSHPNLIGIYDYAEAAERPYLVMEHVPGEDLAERMSRKAGVECERLARELLGALAHIHAAGIVHRDVKPQNVLIAPDGAAKLIDFGIALPRDATALTRTGHLLGTARYIAPEVMSGSPATERSDLYSCGVLLRDCLGDRPPAALGALAERLASVDPADRPTSATEALARLDRTARGGRQSLTERPTEPIRQTPPARPRPPARQTSSRRPWAAAVAVASGAALAAAILVLADRPEENGGGGGGGAGMAAEQRERGEGGQADAAEPAPSVPTPAGSDPARGSSLNQEGFELIQAGRHEQAVPVLEEAVRAFPSGTDDLNYAYALFNLGNALRLSGRPREAIPVLERRLRIPNQIGVVRRELEAAREDARASHFSERP